MKKEKEEKKQPLKMRIPGFLREGEGEAGLGDLIKRMTTSVGIKPCGGCKKRAEALNNWITISRK